MFNTNALTGNLFGAATSISIGAATGTTTINHGLTVAGGTGQSFIVNDGTTNRFTVDSTNGNTSVSGTLGVTGATTLSSTFGVTGDSTLSGDLAVNGGDLTTSAATFNLVNTNATTVNAFGAGTSINLGAVTGTTTIRNNAQINGTLGVTGAALLSSTLGVSDTVSATKASGTGLAVTANATVGGDLTVSGNLTINGTTTNINTTNLVVEDKNVILGDVTTPTNITADGGGITLKGATDKTLNWVSSTAAWTSSENFNVATGKTYKVNGTDVLSNNTLGSGVTASSLTSVGTIAAGTWQATIINPTYGGTGVNNGSKTITLGGNLTTSGAFATTLASTANTNVTLPTTGTLATLANTETFTNKTLTSPVISSIVNTGTLTLPTSTDTLVGRATTDTLTNKTLTSPVISSISNTGTLTLPTSTDTLVGRATTDTLTNKSINLTNNTLTATSLQIATAVTDETGSGSLVFATSPTLTTPRISQIVNTGTLSLPTSTDTLVGRATTDTLTNKTISLTSNTLQATSAELATAISDETGTGSLVFSASPALTGTPTAPTAAAATNTTQIATTAHVFAERSNTLTLTNKTLTSPTINNGSLNMGSGTLVIPTAVTPAQTASGSLVWDSTSNLLTVGDGAARKTLVDVNSTQTLSNKTIVVSPTITLGNHLSGSLTLTNLAGGTLSATLADNVTNQKVGVSRNGGTALGTRKRINFVEGTNVTIAVSDNPTNDCVDVSVTSTGGGGGGTTTGADLREVWLYS